jgi:hypothetical protein
VGKYGGRGLEQIALIMASWKFYLKRTENKITDNQIYIYIYIGKIIEEKF